MRRYSYSVIAKRPKHGRIVRYCQHGRFLHNHLGAAFCLIRNRRLAKDRTLSWYIVNEREKAGLE